MKDRLETEEKFENQDSEDLYFMSQAGSRKALRYHRPHVCMRQRHQGRNGCDVYGKDGPKVAPGDSPSLGVPSGKHMEFFHVPKRAEEVPCERQVVLKRLPVSMRKRQNDPSGILIPDHVKMQI